MPCVLQAAEEVQLDPQQLGITPELERFVCSLTYSTFRWVLHGVADGDKYLVHDVVGVCCVA